MDVEVSAMLGKYVGATLACAVPPLVTAWLARMPRNRWLGIGIGTTLGTLSLMSASGMFWPRAAG